MRPSASDRGPRRARFEQLDRLQRKARREDRTGAPLAIARLDLAAVQLDQLANEREAHAEPAGRRASARDRPA